MLRGQIEDVRVEDYAKGTREAVERREGLAHSFDEAVEAREGAPDFDLGIEFGVCGEVTDRDRDALDDVFVHCIDVILQLGGNWDNRCLLRDSTCI